MYLISWVEEHWGNPYGSICGNYSTVRNSERCDDKDELIRKYNNINSCSEVSNVKIYKQISLKDLE